MSDNSIRNSVRNSVTYHCESYCGSSVTDRCVAHRNEEEARQHQMNILYGNTGIHHTDTMLLSNNVCDASYIAQLY